MRPRMLPEPVRSQQPGHRAAARGLLPLDPRLDRRRPDREPVLVTGNPGHHVPPSCRVMRTKWDRGTRFDLETFWLNPAYPHVAFRTCPAVLWAMLSVPISGAKAGTIWSQPMSEPSRNGGKRRLTAGNGGVDD